MCEIPDRVRKMLWIDGYFAAFWSKVQESNCTHQESYLYVESELEKYGLPPRYDNYESFRQGKKYYWDKNEPLIHFF